jgi:hypothetical protein
MADAIQSQEPAAPLTLRDHIAAEEAPPAADVTATPAVEAVPEADVAAEAAAAVPDAEISEAARTLRRNRAEERKAKIQREIDESVRLREQTRAEILKERAELDRIRAERAAVTARGETPRPIATAGADPAGSLDGPPDPKQYPAEEFDPAFVRDTARYEARMALAAERQQLQQVQSREAQARRLDEQAATAAAEFSDFDATIAPVLDVLKDAPKPFVEDFTTYIAGSEIGARIVYALGKDAALRDRILGASSPRQLITELARAESSLAQTVKPAAAPKPITKAPTPPSRTVGGGASTQELDPNRGLSLKDHIRIEEAAIAAERARGLTR